MAAKGHNIPTEKTKLLQAEIMRLRRDGTPWEKIADTLGYSRAYVYKIFKKGLREIIQEPAEEVLKVELARLDELQVEVLKILRSFHPVVNSGLVVRDVVEDENGNPVTNVFTGQPLTIRIEDSGAKLAAVDRALKIMQLRAKFLGLEKTGNPEKAGMTPEEFAAKVLGVTSQIEGQFKGERLESEGDE